MSYSNKLKFPLVIIAVLAVVIPVFPASGREANRDLSPRGERAKGMVALNLGRYEEAAGHLEAAYAQNQDPLILFALGQAYRLSGNYNKALASFNAFLRSAGPLPKYRPQIDRAATEIELITSTQFRPNTTPGKDLNLNDFGLYLEDPGAKEIEPMPLDPAIAERDEANNVPDPRKTDLTPTSDQLAIASPGTETSTGLNLTPQQQDGPPSNEQKSVLKKWWFWSGVATVAAMGGAATWYFTHSGTEAPNTSFGSIRVFQ